MFEVRGLLGARGLSLADTDAGTTHSSSAVRMRAGYQGVFPGRRSGPGVDLLSVRARRNAQLRGLAGPCPASAAGAAPRLSSSAVPSTIRPPSFSLQCLLSPLPAWVLLALCFTSAPRPSSPPPPRARSRGAFPGSRSGLSGPSRRRRHLPARLPASRSRRGRCGGRGARGRRGGAGAGAGKRLPRGPRRQLRPSSSAPGQPLHAGLRTELRGAQDAASLSPTLSQERSAGQARGRNTTTPAVSETPGLAAG